MRILFADQFSQPGGAQQCLRDVMEEARSRGWSTRLMNPGNGLPASVGSYANGTKSLRDMSLYGADMWKAARAMRRVVREDRIDLIYVNGPRILPAAAMVRPPLVFHSHSLISAPYALQLARWSLGKSRAAVLAASRFVAGPLIGLQCASSVRVIENGVQDQKFEARRLSSQALTIGMVGRIAPEKGHLDFALAARKVARLHPSTRFVVYGAPLFSGGEYEREVRFAASDLNIDFRGWTRDVSQALHSIDLMAVPSGPSEACGRVILEALSAGTPVVAYPSGGICEIIRSRQTGVFTSAANPGALAQSMNELITNRELMRWLAMNGRREWECRFTAERFTREVCDSLERVLEESVRVNTHESRQQHGAPAVG